MARRFRSMALRPINRIKHVVDSQLALAVNTQATINLIQADDSPLLTNVLEVLTGSTVNAIYLKVEISATSSAALANAYMIVTKNPGGNLTFPNANTIGSSDNKKYVIHQEMVMLQREPTADALSGNPRTLFNGVIVIPKGYRRMGPGDFLQLFLLTPGVTADVCIQCHYKEFR